MSGDGPDTPREDPDPATPDETGTGKSGAPLISRGEVAQIAALARLDLAPAEVDAMAVSLARILDYVATLDELRTEGVEPTAHPLPLPTPLRPDTPATPMDPELALANAPARDDWAFVVPKVLPGDEEG